MRSSSRSGQSRTFRIVFVRDKHRTGIEPGQNPDRGDLRWEANSGEAMNSDRQQLAPPGSIAGILQMGFSPSGEPRIGTSGFTQRD
jgi:hypothetical protein